jgi:tripartite-type tricarboxylate transporter receptor subunit TctC
MVHVPYRGAGPALTDLMAARSRLSSTPALLGRAHSVGQAAGARVTTEQPTPALPGVPTLAETVPGYEASAWFGMGAPKGTPRPVIERLNREINAALQDPEMAKKLADLGARRWRQP